MPVVLMYSTAVCSYCINAKHLLHSRGVHDITEIRIDLHPERRDEMVARTGRQTVPQIFIDDYHVGGFDDLAALDRVGGLLPLLQD